MIEQQKYKEIARSDDRAIFLFQVSIHVYEWYKLTKFHMKHENILFLLTLTAKCAIIKEQSVYYK